MKPETFRNLAKKSTERYYTYLDETGKGVDRISVMSIQITGNYVTFTVAKSLYKDSTEYLVYRIMGEDFVFSSSVYDAKKKLLTIRVDPFILSVLQGCTPDDVVLISDMKYLVARVRDWYHQFGSTISLPVNPINLSVSDAINDLKPSEEQRGAIRGILSSPLSYVWGAPGTGKTRVVLSSCVLSYLEAGEKVLLVAPTNNALEQMLYGVIPVIESRGISLTSVFRIGSPSVSFLRKYPLCCENVYGLKRKNELEQTIAKLKITLDAKNALTLFKERRETVLSYLKEIIDFYESMPSKEKEIRKKEKELMELDRSIESLTSFIQTEQFRLSSVSSRMKGILFRTERKHHLEAVSDAILERGTFQRHRMDCETGIKQKWINLEQDREHYRNLYRKCREIMKDDPSTLPTIFNSVQMENTALFLAAADEQEKILLDELNTKDIKLVHKSTIEEEIEWFQKQLDSLNKKEEERAYTVSVFAMTIDKLISSYPPRKVLSYEIKHIFMDEAAYCSFIKGAVLLGYNCPLTLLGDHMQLPPVCEMDKMAMDYPENQCAFLWAQSSIYMDSLFDSTGRELYHTFLQGELPVFHHTRLHSLNLTYRFGEKLSKVLAAYVYTNDFQSASEYGTELIVVNCPYHPGEKKRTNESEAKAIKKYIDENLDDSDSFAILTPYVNQTSLLFKKIPKLKSKERIFTVHASQGREWDTVLLSVVDTSARFFVNTKNSTGLRIVNTAISRTRKRLVLFCDADYWMEHNNEQMISALIEVAKRAKENQEERSQASSGQGWK